MPIEKTKEMNSITVPEKQVLQMLEYDDKLVSLERDLRTCFLGVSIQAMAYI